MQGETHAACTSCCCHSSGALQDLPCIHICHVHTICCQGSGAALTCLLRSPATNWLTDASSRSRRASAAALANCSSLWSTSGFLCTARCQTCALRRWLQVQWRLQQAQSTQVHPRHPVHCRNLESACSSQGRQLAGLPHAPRPFPYRVAIKARILLQQRGLSLD